MESHQRVAFRMFDHNLVALQSTGVPFYGLFTEQQGFSSHYARCLIGTSSQIAMIKTLDLRRRNIFWSITDGFHEVKQHLSIVNLCEEKPFYSQGTGEGQI